MALFHVVFSLLGLGTIALSAPTTTTTTTVRAQPTPTKPASASRAMSVSVVTVTVTKKPSPTPSEKPTATPVKTQKPNNDKKCPSSCVFFVHPATNQCVVFRDGKGSVLGVDNCNIKANVQGHGNVANPAVVTVWWANNTFSLCNSPKIRLASSDPKATNGSTVGSTDAKQNRDGAVSWAAVAVGNLTQFQATNTTNCWTVGANGAISLQLCTGASSQTFRPVNVTSCPPSKNDDCKMMDLKSKQCVTVNPEDRNTTTPSLVMGNCTGPNVIYANLNRGGFIKISYNKTDDMCIGSERDSTSVGASQTLRKCKDRKTNQWTESNGIYANGLGMCMSPSKNGNLQQVPCNASTEVQLTSSCKWKFDLPSTGKN